MHGGDTSTADDGNSSSMAKAFVSGPLLGGKLHLHIFLYIQSTYVCVCVFQFLVACGWFKRGRGCMAIGATLCALVFFWGYICHKKLLQSVPGED